MERFAPQAVVNQLTSLPRRLHPRKLGEYYAANNRVRRQGTASLLSAASRTGVDRFVSQSAAFWYRPTPGAIKSESDPFDTEAAEPIATAARTMEEVEAQVRGAPGMVGVNLRYAVLYGPGTWYAADGDIAAGFRRWQYPIVGPGDAVMSFVHVEDAALATVLAVESGTGGDYNVADDEPAVAADWMPHFARAIGARRPLRIPVWLARLALPAALMHLTLNSRATSNARLKGLGWSPRYPSWRIGFAEGLGRVRDD